MMEGGGAPVPDLEARLQLGHAFAQWCADRAHVRLLHIKGVVAESVLPLSAEVSNDVDILVEPEGLARLMRVFNSVESVEISGSDPSGARGHAFGVVNYAIGVSLDVHLFFPGFRASPEVVFEDLWKRALAIEVGGRSCVVPDRTGTALVGLLHAARNSAKSLTTRRALERWNLLSVAERTELNSLVLTLGAEAAMHVVVGGYPEANRFEVALYLAHRRGAPGMTRWILTFMAVPTNAERLDVLRRAVRSRLHPSVSVWDLARGGQGGVTRRSGVDRLVCPLASLPSAVRGMMGALRRAWERG